MYIKHALVRTCWFSSVLRRWFRAACTIAAGGVPVCGSVPGVPVCRCASVPGVPVPALSQAFTGEPAPRQVLALPILLPQAGVLSKRVVG